MEGSGPLYVCCPFLLNVGGAGLESFDQIPKATDQQVCSALAILQGKDSDELQLPTDVGPTISVFKTWVAEVSKLCCHHACLLTVCPSVQKSCTEIQQPGFA